MIFALQYWSGDEEQALSLARLMARCQSKRRDDSILVLSRRFDCLISEEAQRTRDYCEEVGFRTLFFQSLRREEGHPDGCFGLWAGTAFGLYQMYIGGQLPWMSSCQVAFLEADGVPLCNDFVDRFIASHKHTVLSGKRVTGPIMDRPFPHVNGNLIMDTQLVADYPSLMECPSGVAWDLHMGTILLREARDGRCIQNICGSRDWTDGALSKMACESAWLHGVKDDSAFRWALNNLHGGHKHASRPVPKNLPKRLPLAPVPVPVTEAPRPRMAQANHSHSF